MQLCQCSRFAQVHFVSSARCQCSRFAQVHVVSSARCSSRAIYACGPLAWAADGGTVTYCSWRGLDGGSAIYGPWRGRFAFLGLQAWRRRSVHDQSRRPWLCQPREACRFCLVRLVCFGGLGGVQVAAPGSGAIGFGPTFFVLFFVLATDVEDTGYLKVNLTGRPDGQLAEFAEADASHHRAVRLRGGFANWMAEPVAKKARCYSNKSFAGNSLLDCVVFGRVAGKPWRCL